MARKKKNARAVDVKPAKWLWENDVALLSWLDFSLRYDKEVDFKTSIEGHLNGAFSLEQVDRRLKTIWVSKGPDEPDAPKDWHDIYLRGSLSLHNQPHGLSLSQRDDVAVAVEKLEKDFLLERLTPSRRLRSGSRVYTSSPTQGSRLDSSIIGKDREAQGRKRKFGTDSLTPSVVKPEIFQVDTLARKTNTRRKISKTYSKRNQARSIHAQETHSSLPNQHPSLRARETRSSTFIKDSDDSISDTLDEQPDETDSYRGLSIPFGPLETQKSETRLSPHNPPNRVHDDRTIRCLCSGAVAAYGEENGLIECNQCKSLHRTGCLQSLCQNCKEASEQPITKSEAQNTPRVDSSTETDEMVDPRLQSAIIKIQELQDSLVGRDRELQESKQFVEALNRDIHYLKMAQNQGDEEHGSSTELLVKQKKQIHNLLNDLKARRRLGTFTALPAASRSHGPTRDIKAGFVEACHSSHMIFLQLEVKQLACIPQLHLHENLLGLARRIAGSRHLPALQLQDGTFWNAEPVVLLRSLSTAALQEWVFEADFPNFEDESSITLAAYRNILANQDGALALRNLDLAAFEVKIESPEFRTLIIPKEAQRLAIKLSQTLAPFFSCNPKAPEGMSWDGFATWGDEMEIWKDRQEHLVKMFAEALTTKASSCLNIEDYEMVIYAPGTKFDSNTMEAEKMDGTPDTSDYDGRVLLICAQAALFVYARVPVATDGSVSETIISARNFVRRDENNRKGAIPCLKAVVVLAE